MKYIYTLIVFLSITSTSFGQNIYSDALKLRSYINNDRVFKGDKVSRDSIARILYRHIDDPRIVLPQVSFANVHAAIGDPSVPTYNSFMGPFFVDDANGLDRFPASISGVVSKVGGLDVTNIADGLAKFLVMRAKEELNIAFFRKFKQELLDPKYIDARILFGNTWRLLGDIGDNIYLYEQYITALREAFKKDIRALPEQLQIDIEQGSYSSYLNAHPYLKYTAQTGFYIMGGIRDSINAGYIIEHLSDKDLDALAAASADSNDTRNRMNLAGAIKTFRLISTSFKASDTSNYWYGKDSVSLLEKDTILQQIYLGLLYERGKKIRFADTTLSYKLNALMTDVNMAKDSVRQYISVIRSFVDKAHHVDELLEKYKDLQGKDSLSFEDYSNYISNFIGLFEEAHTFLKLPGIGAVPAIAKADSLLERYIDIARSLSNLIIDVKQKNYSSAILETYHVYSFVFNKNITEAWNKNGDAQKDIVYRTQQFQDILFKYGTFMASVVEAKTSDEVANVIESFVLPVGSSIIKRTKQFNISLNAFVGLYGGYEYIKGANNKFPNAFGVAAPVGVAFNWGKVAFPLKKSSASFSAFISIIDLGALAAFRFSDSTTATVPTIQLQDIVSPGIFFSYGISNCPISLNVGGQMGPMLRKVDAGTINNLPPGTDPAYKLYYRLSFSILVDIPLLNLYTSVD